MGAKAAAPVTAGPTPGPTQPATAASQDEDLDVLKTVIADAERQLARSPKMTTQRVKTRVTDLPLYILAGAEGGGKTSTFLQSAIEPELLAGQVHRDSAILPTRLCNLWFARNAIFAEPSGRFFSEPPGRWLRMLTALRAKPRRLLGGRGPSNLRAVVLFCDASQFMGVPDAGRQAAIARAANERLRLVGEAFGTDFPAYVVFTKSDSIPYFRDYFGRLNEGEDQQPLGCLFPPARRTQSSAGDAYADAESKRLVAALNELYQSLTDHRLTFLARETDPARKPGVYEFPRELKRIRGALVQYLVDVFRPNPLQPGPLLRGCYFTGTRQVASGASRDDLFKTRIGGPSAATRLFRVDDVKTEMSRASEREHEPLETRWTFVSQLFTGVILPGGAQPATQYIDRRGELYRRVAYGAAAAAAVVLLGLFGWSFWNNQRLLGDVEQAGIAAQAVPSRTGEIAPASLDAIDRLRHQLELLTTYEEDTPWRINFGLYQGDEVMQPALQLYFARFREYFLRDAEQSLTTTLAALPLAQSPEFPAEPVYERLKAYLSITNQECAPERPALPRLLTSIWSRRRNDTADRSYPHFDFYTRALLQKRVPFTLDARKDLISRGRDYLKGFGPEERVYRAILEQVNKSAGQPVRVRDYVDKHGLVLSGPQEIEPAFTRDGWAQVEERIKNVDPNALGQSCVLAGAAGGEIDPDSLKTALRTMYASDYIRRWTEFLAGTRLLAFDTAQDAARKLAVLENYDSPIVGVLYMVHEHTAVAQTNLVATAQQVAKSQGGLLGRLSARLGKAQDLAKKANILKPDLPPPDVNRAFQPVHVLFSKEASRSRWIDTTNKRYVSALGEMQKAMSGVAATPDDVAANTQAGKARHDGLAVVKDLAYTFDRAPGSVHQEVLKLLESPFNATEGKYIADFGKAGAKKLNAAGAQLCAKLKPLLAKYPFNAMSDQDARPEDVAAFFAPQGGALWAFHQQNLAPVLVKQGRRWSPRADTQGAPQLAPEFLEFYNRVSLISDMLFPEGGAMPRMRYRLSPLPNPVIKSMKLTIDGVTMAQGSQQFAWPGANPQELVLKVVVGGDAEVPFASFAGPWAIFQLVADADPRQPGSSTISVTELRRGRRGRPEPVNVAGKPVTVSLRIDEFPGGVESAFDKNFFTLRCPSKVALE
jgi:type VI secretion system protein ImpL